MKLAVSDQHLAFRRQNIRLARQIIIVKSFRLLPICHPERSEGSGFIWPQTKVTEC